MNEHYESLGDLKRGVLTVRNRRRFDAALREIRDGVVLVRVERVRARRSLNQNAYWWGMCVALVADHTGYTPEEVHELAKAMFLDKRQAAAGTNGRLLGEYVIGGSTARLNKLQFSEFVERFRAWAESKLNVVIPSPQEYEGRTA